MAMKALNAISSSLYSTAHVAAEGPSFAVQRSSQRRAVNFPSVSGRVAASAHRRWVTIGEKRVSCAAVRDTEAVEAVTFAAAAPAEISLGELKTMSDSYFSTDTRPVILFDGVCNMCNGGVNFMLDNDKEGKMRFAALQSDAGRALLVRSGRAPDDLSSILLVGKDRSYRKSDAILRIGQFLHFPYSPAAFLGLIVPMFLRDTLYDAVADNRYSVFGKTDACRLSDTRFTERFIE